MDYTWTSILLGAAAGGVVIFVWFGLVWMAFKYHDADFRGVGDALPDVEAAMAKMPAERGVFYAVPFMNDYPGGQNDPDLKARMEKGPNAMITMLPPDCMNGATFLRGFLLNLFDGLCLAVLCSLIAVPELVDKVLLCGGIGAFVAISGYCSMSNWMFFPWRFSWLSVVDRVVGYVGVGVVLHFILSAPVAT